MRTAIVHVGMHKTGSTSIQDALAASDACVYPTFDGYNNHNFPLFLLLKDRAEAQKRLQKRRASNKGRDLHRSQVEAALVKAALRAEMAGLPFVLSSEGLYSEYGEEELERLQDFLTLFDQVGVIAYVRPPVGYLQSVFQQKIKVGELREFDLYSCFKGYCERFERLDRVFGADRVELVKFSRDHMQGDVVQDFFARIGLSVPRQNHFVNTAMSAGCTALVYCLTRLVAARNVDQIVPARKWIIDHANQGDRLVLPPELVTKNLAPFSKDIAWMERRLGADLDEALQEGCVVTSEADMEELARHAISQINLRDAPQFARLRIKQVAASLAG